MMDVRKQNVPIQMHVQIWHISVVS